MHALKMKMCCGHPSSSEQISPLLPFSQELSNTLLTSLTGQTKHYIETASFHLSWWWAFWARTELCWWNSARQIPRITVHGDRGHSTNDDYSYCYLWVRILYNTCYCIFCFPHTISIPFGCIFLLMAGTKSILSIYFNNRKQILL